MDTLIYDIETAKEVKEVKGGWNNPFAMEISSCVIYSMDKDRYYFFLHPESRPKIAAMLNGNKVVTHNGVNFDSKVVLGNDRILSASDTGLAIKISKNGTEWKEFDTMNQCIMKILELTDPVEAAKNFMKGVGKRLGLKLDDLTGSTLGIHKYGDGALAPILYKQKKYDELLDYNLHDVRMTRKLFEHIMSKKFVLTGNKTRLSWESK